MSVSFEQAIKVLLVPDLLVGLRLLTWFVFALTPTVNLRAQTLDSFNPGADSPVYAFAVEWCPG